ncbi:phage antirepressor [Paraburkholderia sp. Tr-20389]|uniref:BRO family protein n=1 Tax=Paraburkholderia sp. Tr-20389 TaxID=2703903 RepID=UPI00197DBC92|nr:phage antirepressor [Paraburkholderia sp. Tr-20389]
MTNLIIPFNFESFAIRIQKDESGEPWFCANDVCAALAYSNARDAIAKHVHEDDVAKRDIIDAMGRAQASNHINESGLYALILGSTKDEARRFKRWVTSEVLPAIRKTGSYSTPKAGELHDAVRLFQPFFEIAVLIGCDRQAAAISANQAVQTVSGANVLQLMGRTHIEASNQESLYFTPTELGRRCGTSARNMNLLLSEAGLQTKPGDKWEPTEAGRRFSRIFDTGKKHGSGAPVPQVKWSADVLEALTPPKKAA